MTTTTNSTRYENGNRIVEQTVTYATSDDIIQLAQYQNQLGYTVKRIEDLKLVEATEATAQELSRLAVERARFEQLVIEQQAIVDGYAAGV